MSAWPASPVPCAVHLHISCARVCYVCVRLVARCLHLCQRQQLPPSPTKNPFQSAAPIMTICDRIDLACQGSVSGLTFSLAGGRPWVGCTSTQQAGVVLVRRYEVLRVHE